MAIREDKSVDYLFCVFTREVTYAKKYLLVVFLVFFLTKGCSEYVYSEVSIIINVIVNYKIICLFSMYFILRLFSSQNFQIWSLIMAKKMLGRRSLWQ